MSNKNGNMVQDNINSLIPVVLKSIRNKFDDYKFKTEENLGNVYQEYIEFTYKRYSLIKTLLYKNEPKNLYNFYEHVFLESDSRDVIETENTSNIFHQRNIIITGTGGIGKSLLMRHIFLDQLRRGVSVPIFVDLKNINNENIDDFCLEKYIHDLATDQQLSINYEQFKYTMLKGVYTLIFDGFDELKMSHTQKVQDEIKRVSDRYSKNNLIVSSRPSDSFMGWENFYQYSIKNLNKQQAISLIKKLEYDPMIKNIFSEDLDNKLYKTHRSFASIPLLLTIMLLTYEVGGNIPDNLTEFYNQAFYTLYQKHDTSKSGYKRELRAKLPPEQFKEVLAYIALKSFFANKVYFSINDFREYADKFKNNNNCEFKNMDVLKDASHAACMLLREGEEIRFTHRSFQEYFAAIHVSKLSDDIQRKLLVSWAENDRRNISYNITFLSTLLTIQSNRTYYNLAIPLIEKIEKKYVKNRFDIKEFINQVFIHFVARKTRRKNEENGELEIEKKVSFKIKDEFAAYFFIHFYLFDNLNVQLEEVDNNPDEMDERLYSLIEGEKLVIFEEVESEIIEEEIKNFVTSWFIPRLEYLIQWKNELLSKKGTKKRKYTSILDDL